MQILATMEQFFIVVASGEPNLKYINSCVLIRFDVCVIESERVRVAVRIRPRNSDDLSDMDYADCVELQPEVSIYSLLMLISLYRYRCSACL